MNELNLYRAVAQARQDIGEGIDVNLAIRTAARRYNVSADAVQAYAVIAHGACCKDAFKLLLGRRYNRTKKQHGGDRKASAQNDHLKTAEALAKGGTGANQHTEQKDQSDLSANTAAKAADTVENGRRRRNPAKADREFSGGQIDPPKNRRQQQMIEEGEIITIESMGVCTVVCTADYPLITVRPPGGWCIRMSATLIEQMRATSGPNERQEWSQ